MNGVASFDLDSAIALTCDLLRHQGAPVPKDVTLRVALAAPDLLTSLVELLACVDERCGGKAEGNSRLVMACDNARVSIAQAEGSVYPQQFGRAPRVKSDMEPILVGLPGGEVP